MKPEIFHCRLSLDVLCASSLVVDDVWCPVQLRGVAIMYIDGGGIDFLLFLDHEMWRDAKYIFALDVANDTQMPQSVDDIIACDRCHFTQFLDRNFLLSISNDVKQNR